MIATAIAIEHPSASYQTLETAARKPDMHLQPDETAIRVDFRLFGYRWIRKGARGLKTRNGGWIKFKEVYPIGGHPTLRIAKARGQEGAR